MRATIDETLCAGCAVCEDVCPEVFEMGDDGIAKVKVVTVPPEAEDACRAAADQCPSEAITIHES
ncbi:MAG: ferredoxin [Rhodopirellula sp.]|nr:ferredoxin [Rhodopirellula sp.]